MTRPRRIVRFLDPPLLFATLLLSGAGIAVSSAFAAESFDCGPTGKPNASSAKCDCSGGKVEVTIGKVSRCTTPQVKPPRVPQPTAPTTSACPAGQHASEGKCCGPGEEWFAKASRCSCVDAAVCGAGRPQTPAGSPPPNAPVKATVSSCPSDMVLIPGGSYWVGTNERGSTNAFHLNQRKLGAYCMDRTEVTVADYEACVASGACSPAAKTVQWRRPSERYSSERFAFWSRFCNSGRDDRKDHPINCVDWTQAASFCEAFDKRLPTEDEWEVAARGPQGRTYPWGNEKRADAGCWGRFDYNLMVGKGTCPVYGDAAGATPTGLHGMAGNVWEWTSGRFEFEGLVSYFDRGGAWSNGAPVPAIQRAKNDPDRRGSNVGFRCAR